MENRIFSVNREIAICYSKQISLFLGETKHKLTLFYLCNDVVQQAKRKKALYYLENFKDNLREAVMHVR